MSVPSAERKPFVESIDKKVLHPSAKPRKDEKIDGQSAKPGNDQRISRQSAKPRTNKARCTKQPRNQWHTVPTVLNGGTVNQPRGSTKWILPDRSPKSQLAPEIERTIDSVPNSKKNKIRNGYCRLGVTRLSHRHKQNNPTGKPRRDRLFL